MSEKTTQDYIVRAMTADQNIRAFAILSTDLVEEARKHHNTSPVITAALGRLLTGAAMMGTMLKGEDDLLTLKIQTAGPVKGMTVTADAKGNVKGYAIVPDVMLPPNSKGKLDVGGAVAPGELVVIRDMGLKEPYVGRVLLQTGEIGDDLTYYFASSEQTPSAVGLGVLMDHDNTVRKAGGFIIQLMPNTPDEVIDGLEQRIAKISSVTDLLEEGYLPETLLSYILDDPDFIITDRIPAAFSCNCSRERVEKVLYSIGREELEDIIRDGEDIEVKCHFCNTGYNFTIEDIKKILG